MSNRQKIMDKYWVEFLKDVIGDSSTWKGGSETHFWFWFYNHKMTNNPPLKLEDYL